MPRSILARIAFSVRPVAAECAFIVTQLAIPTPKKRKEKPIKAPVHPLLALRSFHSPWYCQRTALQ
jgi:hypothetical protein